VCLWLEYYMIVGVSSDGHVAMEAAQETDLAEFAELVDCGDLVDRGNGDVSRPWRLFVGVGLLA
jgi:hypothetical protein